MPAYGYALLLTWMQCHHGAIHKTVKKADYRYEMDIPNRDNETCVPTGNSNSVRLENCFLSHKASDS